MSAADIASAKAALPGLWEFEDPPPTPEQVALAVEFLETIGPARRTFWRSYDVASVAENWLKFNRRPGSITRAAVVVAAHKLGFPIHVKRYRAAAAAMARISVRSQPLVKALRLRRPS